MPEDYYQILGVPKTATPDEIAKAYRTQARKLHPDLNPDDPKAKEKFQHLQEAFDVLGNPEKRKVFDQFGISPDKMGQGPSGNDGFQWNGARSPFSGHYGGGGRTSSTSENMDLDDILNMFGMGGMGGMGGTGRGRRSAAPQQTRGANIDRTISVPFTIAIAGGKQDQEVRWANGQTETITVSIPAGIEDGKRIRLRGKGEPGLNGGKSGDLFFTVKVQPHPSFRRDGNNLYVSVPITLNEAVFGAKIDIPTQKGTVVLSVPAGSSSGTKLRIKGLGVPPAPKSSAAPGDLFAELMIVLPNRWDAEDKELIARLRSDPPEPIRDDLKW